MIKSLSSVVFCKWIQEHRGLKHRGRHTLQRRQHSSGVWKAGNAAISNTKCLKKSKHQNQSNQHPAHPLPTKIKALELQVLCRFVVARTGGSYWNSGFGFCFSVSLLRYIRLYTKFIFSVVFCSWEVVAVFHGALMRGRSCFELFNKQCNKLQEFPWLVIDRIFSAFNT